MTVTITGDKTESADGLSVRTVGFVSTFSESLLGACGTKFHSEGSMADSDYLMASGRGEGTFAMFAGWGLDGLAEAGAPDWLLTDVVEALSV